ncbi:MAG: hypothetical protein AB1758_16650, partial [Candidatus Eremiobacterota bacterium]
ALRTGRLVVAHTVKNPPKAGLIGNHAYTVTGYDMSGDSISVRNPWGRGEPMVRLGNVEVPADLRDDGHFRLSFQEFMQNFAVLSLENIPVLNVAMANGSDPSTAAA